MDEFLEAVTKGDRARVRAMLAQDPSLVDRKSEPGVSAVLMAVYYQKPEIAHDLVAAGARVEIFEAAALGDAKRARELLQQDPGLANAFAVDGFQPLGLASFFRQPELVSLLLDAGAEVNSASRNSQRVMPLHSSVASHSLDITRALLEHGADVNAMQQDRYTPLLEAARAGELEILELLLQYGADPLARGEDGQAALDLARQAGHSDIVARLTAS
jgi:ankyrin repeat protein